MSIVLPRLRAPLFLFLALLLSLGAARAATLEQVKQLMHAGHLVQADHAMAEVLAAQPDSALAHYIDARLLGAEGKWPLAEKELEVARNLDPTLSFAPGPQVQAFADKVLHERWKNPKGFAGYGQAALAALFVLISGYLIYGVVRARRRAPKA